MIITRNPVAVIVTGVARVKLIILFFLSQLALGGNPLCFHPKHRLKTVENLSNLINKSSVSLYGVATVCDYRGVESLSGEQHTIFF